MSKTSSFDLNSASDAQTAVIRHIGIGYSSSGKTRDYLKRKGFSDSSVNEAVEALIKRGYIDDERAGRKVLLVRSGKKQESRMMLRQRLFAAGVRSDIADKLITEVEEDSVLCFNLLLSVRPEADSMEEAQDLEQELIKTAYKRGFSAETARSAYGKWLESVLD